MIEGFLKNTPFSNARSFLRFSGRIWRHSDSAGRVQDGGARDSLCILLSSFDVFFSGCHCLCKCVSGRLPPSLPSVLLPLRNREKWVEGGDPGTCHEPRVRIVAVPRTKPSPPGLGGCTNGKPRWESHFDFEAFSHSRPSGQWECNAIGRRHSVRGRQKKRAGRKQLRSVALALLLSRFLALSRVLSLFLLGSLCPFALFP